MISREKRLREPLARLYSAEILLALEHLHERKIVFRDLKPDNVVLDKDGHVLLTDFGLSKEGVSVLDGTKSFCGSVAYLAPEMLKRRGHGHAVDLYGLGVLLYEMMSGMPPFYHHDREQLFRNIELARLRIPTYVPPMAADLIGNLMNRDPTQRLGAKNTKDAEQHRWFEPIDFGKLLRREIAPPLDRQKLPLGGDQSSTSHPFDLHTPMLQNPFARHNNQREKNGTWLRQPKRPERTPVREWLGVFLAGSEPAPGPNKRRLP